MPSLYRELNRVFMPDEEWTLGESLDALDDVLYGGFGVLEGAEPVRVVWADHAVSRRALGVETTREYYRAKLARPDVYASAPAAPAPAPARAPAPADAAAPVPAVPAPALAGAGFSAVRCAPRAMPRGSEIF